MPRNASGDAGCAIAKCRALFQWGDVIKDSPLDNPHNAAHAWSRFRRIMQLLAGVTAMTVLVVEAALWIAYPDVSIHFFIAVALGIALTMGLGGALMALSFLSNGTGHDEAVDNRLPDADELFGTGERER